MPPVRASARLTVPASGASDKPLLPVLTMMQKAICVKATEAAIYSIAVQAADPTTECIRNGGDFVALAVSTRRLAHHDDKVSIDTIAKALELQVRKNYFVNEVVLKAARYHVSIVASQSFRLGCAAADAAKADSSARSRDTAAASKDDHTQLSIFCCPRYWWHVGLSQ